MYSDGPAVLAEGFFCFFSLRSLPSPEDATATSYPQIIMFVEGMLQDFHHLYLRLKQLEFAIVRLRCWHTIRKRCFPQNSKMDSLLIPHLLKSLKLSAHRFKIVPILVQPACRVVPIMDYSPSKQGTTCTSSPSRRAGRSSFLGCLSSSIEFH